MRSESHEKVFEKYLGITQREIERAMRNALDLAELFNSIIYFNF